MPRNSQGIYSLPAGNPVVPGTVIESTWANPTMDDIAAALTGSLPRDGSAPMTGPLILSSSSPSNPREAISKSFLEQFVAYSSGMPVGAILPYAGSVVPGGFILCDGQAVSRTTYADLFAAIGTIYGAGDNTTTFNVPDLRDQFIRGLPASGRALGSKQTDAIKSHTHSVNDPGHTHTVTDPGHSHTIQPHTHSVNDPGHTHSIPTSLQSSNGDYGNDNAAHMNGTASATGNATTGITIASTSLGAESNLAGITMQSGITNLTVGSTGDSETRPVNVAMNYYIKAVQDGVGGGSGGSGTLIGITSSDSNAIAIDNTDPAIPELDIKTNIAFGLVKLDAGNKIPPNLLPVTNTSFLGLWDASGGQNPSEAYPAYDYNNGDEYVISVSGVINVYDPATLSSVSTLLEPGDRLIYLEGQAGYPNGWYGFIITQNTSAVGISFVASGSISASNVQAAIEELDAETIKTGSFTASQVINVPSGSIAATNVQAAINELATEKANVSALTAANIVNTPAGGISATTVQAALNELDTEKSSTSHNHSVNTLSNVVITNAQDGQALVWDTTTGKWVNETVSGGGGVSDHGALTGLGDDDHTQYLNNARGDLRYSPLGHNHNLSGLSDVDVTGLLDGYMLVWDQGTGKWVVDAIPSGGALALNDLTDVTAPAPATNDVLAWNGTAWVNTAPSSGGSTTLDGLTDVTITTPADNNLLTWDTATSQWTNQTASQAGLSTTADLSAHLTDTTAAHAASAISCTATGDVSATNVQAAIAELASEKATAASLTNHVSAASGAHAATAISFSPTGGIAANTVQAAIAELDTEKVSATALNDHINDTTAAHAASAISYAGGPGISATNVEAALDELATEKSDVGHTHTGVYQPADAQLDTLAAITAQQATDLASISTFIGTLMNDADAATARTTLGAASTTEVDALKDVPANPQTTSYTLALADRGKSVDTTAGVTVPPNGTVAFPVGSTVTITNTSSAAVTVTQGSGVTMRQAGTANTGNRTLAAYGVATVRKTATDTWFISGAGLS